MVEADESDRSFLELDPEVAVMTNMELDHHATYRSIGELEAAFGAFAAGAAGVGAIVPARRAGPTLRAPPSRACSPTGSAAGDLAAERVELEPLGSRFTVEGLGVALRVPGEHNVLNALGALAACRAAGVPLAEATAALEGFTGAGRRFEDRAAPRPRARDIRRLRPPSDGGARHARGGADARRRAASWPASSRTSTRGRGTSRGSSGVRSRWPT